jgi:hypothetical protein
MKPLPYKYYREYCGELARAYLDAKFAPRRQQKRIEDVIESGLDYEPTNIGYTKQIPLSKLYKFLEDARAVDVDKMKEVYLNFKNNHIGVKAMVVAYKNDGWKYEEGDIVYYPYFKLSSFSLYGVISFQLFSYMPLAFCFKNEKLCKEAVEEFKEEYKLSRLTL